MLVGAQNQAECSNLCALAPAHGADVLLVTSPALPDLPMLDVDTSRGKRTTQLDLTLPSNCETFKSLVTETDVFLQAYRPSGLAEKGLGPGDIVSMRDGKGVVYASLRAYGWEGPWKDRRGVSQDLQSIAHMLTTQ